LKKSARKPEPVFAPADRKCAKIAGVFRRKRQYINVVLASVFPDDNQLPKSEKI
jgi:hypothetical protein